MTDSRCCRPLADGAISPTEAADLASVFKALADPARLRILSALIATEGHICACDFVTVVGKSQPTVSHHLKVLREAGLVEGTRRGTWVWYTVVPSRLAEIRGALELEQRVGA